jgi:hypothetical protein
MQNDPGAEWQRLTRVYHEKSDEELLELAEEFGNLTETAQQVLRDEMRKRSLAEPKPAPVADSKRSFGEWNPAAEQDSNLSAAADSADDDVASRAYLCECEDSDQVNQLGEALRCAGIESWAENLHAPFADRGLQTCRIFVRADQLAMAREIAARPIPQDIRDETTAPVGDFDPPICPRCGAADPLLESIEPSNRWACENCGARWSDPVG